MPTYKTNWCIALFVCIFFACKYFCKYILLLSLPHPRWSVWSVNYRWPLYEIHYSINRWDSKPVYRITYNLDQDFCQWKLALDCFIYLIRPNVSPKCLILLAAFLYFFIPIFWSAGYFYFLSFLAKHLKQVLPFNLVSNVLITFWSWL